MKVQLTHILQNMFQASSLDEVPVNKLEQIVQEHPYFAPAHFLLAKKLQQNGNGAYEQQAQKAALYFHDPLWLHWQLNHSNAVEEIKESEVQLKTQPDPEPEVQVEIVPEAEQEVQVEEAEVEVAPEPEPEPQPESFMQPEAQPETEAQLQPEAQSPPDPEPAPQPKPEPEPLPIDPYYTIDYFASQGIKVSQEVKPDDKLGRQLKSFTEWLRTMKRMPQQPIAEEPADEAEQQNIQRFAAGSLEQKEVVTETMAEVLVKQDKKEEAIAIYEKLSLLDPSKKAFFAAKIENLKSDLI